MLLFLSSLVIRKHNKNCIKLYFLIQNYFGHETYGNDVSWITILRNVTSICKYFWEPVRREKEALLSFWTGDIELYQNKTDDSFLLGEKDQSNPV